MRISTYILFLAIITCLSNCKEHEKKIEIIENISFSYNGGLRIPYNKVNVNIEKNNEEVLVFVETKPLKNGEEWNYSKIDTIFNTDCKSFEKLANSLSSLEKINIDKAERIGLDGYSCKIEFGAKGKNKSYTFWSPTTETKERDLSNFVNLCEKILKISGLEKENILE